MRDKNDPSGGFAARTPLLEKPALAEIDALCRRSHIRSLRLFGSFLRGEARADSDIDLLVEFEPGTHVSLLDLVRIEDELSGILKRRVDLRTGPELSRHFRSQVLSEARSLYG